VQTLGTVFANECFGETKETKKNEGILCLGAHKEKYVAAGAGDPSELSRRGI